MRARNSLPTIGVAIGYLLTAACTDDATSPAPEGLSDVQRAFIEEIATEAALGGFWVAAQSYRDVLLGTTFVGVAHSLVGVPAGVLATVIVVEEGATPVSCEDSDPPEAWRTCLQLTTDPEGFVDASAFLPAMGDSRDGTLEYAAEQITGMIAYDPVPASDWRIDFRASAAPAIRGTAADGVVFTPEDGGAVLDLSHTATIEVSSLDLEQSVVSVAIEFPGLHPCGTITVAISDDGHDALSGSVQCGSAQLATIAADEETFYRFSWE